MKKDIQFLHNKSVKVAIARKKNELAQYEWTVYLLNSSKETLKNVFVVSKGYSSKEQTAQKTSTFRHFFEQIGPKQAVLVEPIMPELFHLFNEFWVSYYIDNQIHDKKFTFVPGSITEENLRNISLLKMEGIVHG